MSDRNRLKICCPDETPTYLQVELNGKRVENLISLKVEVPSGKKTPLVRIRLDFYSSLDADMICNAGLRDGKAIVLLHPAKR